MRAPVVVALLLIPLVAGCTGGAVSKPGATFVFQDATGADLAVFVHVVEANENITRYVEDPFLVKAGATASRHLDLNASARYTAHLAWGPGTSGQEFSPTGGSNVPIDTASCKGVATYTLVIKTSSGTMTPTRTCG